MSYLPLGMSPDQILRQPSALVTELQQGIILLNELQPQIKTLPEDPVLFASNYKVSTPMFVSTLSHILQADEAAKGQGTFASTLSLEKLHAVESRSLVITAGSVEADAASRWIGGMLSASVQKKWYTETKRLSAGKQETELETGEVETRYSKVKNQSWFSKDYNPVQWAESKKIIIRFEKRVQQFLKGEINAAQYVSSIRKANNR